MLLSGLFLHASAGYSQDEPTDGEPPVSDRAERALSALGDPRTNRVNDADELLTKPKPRTVSAIQELLSANEALRRRGEKTLRLLGAAVIPELKYWAAASRGRAELVDELIAEMEGRTAADVRVAIAVRDYLKSRFVEAKALAGEGHYRRALRLSQAILTLDDTNADSWAMRRFVRHCRERLVAAELIEPSFQVASQVYEIGRLPDLTFRLVNRQRGRVLIHLERGVIGEADVSIQRHFADGSWKHSTRRLRVKVDGNQDTILLGPGKSWETRIPLPLDEPLPLAGVVARVKIAGRFRPTRWTAGDPNENVAIKLPDTEFWVVPPGQSKLCGRPLEKLSVAILLDKAESFFVGGQLAVWAGEYDDRYNGKLVETLVLQLDTLEPAQAKLAHSFLRQATGYEFDSVEAWRKWWGELTGGETEGAQLAN